MGSDLLLGIDIGTSSAKGVLLDRHGNTLAEAASAPYPIHHPRDGWAEQDPNDWWQAVRAVCHNLAKSGDIRRVAAIGVSGQGCACTLVDDAVAPLRPAIIWLDTRSHRQADLITARWGQELIASNGNAVSSYNVEPKLLWLREHEPEALNRAAAVLTTTAYVNARLTGRFAMNVADGGILHAFDARESTWNTAMLAEMGIDPALYPPLAPCTSIIGNLTPEAAKDTGLPEGTPVVAGGEDTPAAALSIGIRSPGDAFLSLGTAAVAGVCLEAEDLPPEPTILTYPHVIPGLSIRSGSMSSAGAAIAWWLREFGQVYGDVSGLNAAIERSSPGAGGVTFLPYLSGELHPLLDPAARGVFFGVSLSTTADDMARALVEGNAMAIRHNLEVAVGGGEMPRSLRATGGPSTKPPVVPGHRRHHRCPGGRGGWWRRPCGRRPDRRNGNWARSRHRCRSRTHGDDHRNVSAQPGFASSLQPAVPALSPALFTSCRRFQLQERCG